MVYINSYKDQSWLIPQSIKEIIPKGHICFFVEEFGEYSTQFRENLENEGWDYCLKQGVYFLFADFMV